MINESTRETEQANHYVTGLESYFRQHAPHPTENEAKMEWASPITRVILKWIGKGQCVLDLGCHKGHISALIQKAGNKVTGVDLPAVAKSAHELHGIDVVGHDLNKPLPFEDNQFDVVLAASVLDYLVNDLTFLRECYRVLRPAGMLVLVVPNEVSLYRRIITLLGRMDRDFDSPYNYHALHRYSLKGIQSLVSHAGFNVISYEKCPKGYSNIPLRCWLESKLPITFATDIAVKAIKPSANGGN